MMMKMTRESRGQRLGKSIFEGKSRVKNMAAFCSSFTTKLNDGSV